MKTTNIETGAARIVEAGLVWKELLTNSAGTLELPAYATFRVRSAAINSTVTIDGVLAMTMASGEIALFNTGFVDSDSYAKKTITVVITGTCYMQLALDRNHKH